MDVVGARFQSDASDCAGLPAELGPRIDLRIELLNRIYRYKGGGITDDSGGVSDAQAHEGFVVGRSEEHTSELQSRLHLVCRLLIEKKNRLIYLRHFFLLRLL